MHAKRGAGGVCDPIERFCDQRRVRPKRQGGQNTSGERESDGFGRFLDRVRGESRLPCHSDECQNLGILNRVQDDKNNTL